VKSKFEAIKGDPKDGTIIETAYDGRVDLIVTGDSHLLLELGNFRGIKIISVENILNTF